MALSPQIKDPLKLCPCVRLRLEQVQREMRKKAVPLTIIETLRAFDRQMHYLEIGATTTLNSKHLPHAPNALSLAVDIAPTAYLKLKSWNPGGAYWRIMGAVGKNVGLEWGGDWKSFVDLCHFQLKECLCPKA